MKTLKTSCFDSNIFETEENDSNKYKQETMTKKFNRKDFILKRKKSKTDETIKSSKKMKLEEKIVETEIVPENNQILSRNDEQSAIPVIPEVELSVNKLEIKQDEQLQPLVIKSVEQETIKEPEIIPQPVPPTIIDQPVNQKSNVDNNVSINITMPSETIKPSNTLDSRAIITSKHPPTPLHPFPQIPTPDTGVFTPHQPYFSYPFFAPPPPGRNFVK